jgi:hypothetical protein
VITLPLSFLAPQLLAVQLLAATPVLALALPEPPALGVQLLAKEPTLRLVLRAPQVLDAALLPVLIGPPGNGAATTPVSRTLSWAAGRLAGVAFADGRSKALTWSGDQLTRVDHLRPGLPTQRADLAYNPDGTLASVTQSEA